MTEPSVLTVEHDGAPDPAGPGRLGLSLPQVWAILAVLLPIVASLGATNFVRDFGYQIRAGNMMLDGHRFIRTEPFTFTAGGSPWLNQQWGADILFALIYRWMGWAGFAVTRAALNGLIFLFVYLAARAAGARTKVAAWLTLGALLVSVLQLGLRPQLLAAALFACTLWLIAGRGRHPRRLWVVPALVALWSNVHGTFFLGPLLLLLAWLADRTSHNPQARHTLRVALVALAATLLNPFGLGAWSYVFRLSTNPLVTRFVAEWKPPTLREVDGVLFFASALAVVVYLARRLRSNPVSGVALLTLGLFLLVALQASRGILWWALVVPVTMAGVLATQGTGEPRDDRSKSITNTVVVLVVVALGVTFLPWWRDRTPIGPSTGLVSDAPAALTNHLSRLLAPGQRIFGPEAWGSWIELQLPRNPTFVDSRIEVFPSAVWRDYVDVSNGQQGWQGILDRWNVDVVIAERGEQALLIPIIRRDPGWKLVYEDEKGVAFVRA
jgi:hypothetical protein